MSGQPEGIRVLADHLEDDVAIDVLPADVFDRGMLVIRQGGDEIHMPAVLWKQFVAEVTPASELLASFDEEDADRA